MAQLGTRPLEWPQVLPTMQPEPEAVFMNNLDEIISEIPMQSLADQLGVDPGTAESAVRQALPALIGGMQANAADPAGEASLAGALNQHSPELVQGGVDLEQVDTDDGERIVGHVFGGNSDQVAQTLGGNLGGGSGDLIKKLLPILAPIVLSYLSQRLRAGGAGGLGGPDTSGQQSAGGGLGDLLGSILGGGGGQGSQSGSIMDMLGGLLGGGRR